MTPPTDAHDPSDEPRDPSDDADERDDDASTGGDDAIASLDEVDFKRLGLRNQLLRRLSETGYDTPTPIQREAIPHLLAGRDLLGQAATGTGKTAAFALPILHAIGRVRATTPRALVIAPTRELALQVDAAIAGYGTHLGIRTVAVVGGQPAHRQVKALTRGVHVVVATPGRAVDLIGRGALDLSSVDTVVLDEADEMLDMGFAEDLDAILDAAPDQRQTVLFSATVPARIDHLAAQHLDDPVRIVIARPTTDSGAPLVEQRVAWVRKTDKAAALGRFLDMETPEAAIVFCRTRVEVDALTATMNARGHRAEALHGGMDQRQRDAVMRRLRDGSATLLLATDVAARGLDVDTLTHVFNLDVPSQAEAYVHRIGRVGRAGRRGVAITLAEPRQKRNIGFIERLLGRKLPVVEVPSVEDLHARQVELTAQDVAEALAEDPADGAEEVLAILLDDDHEPHDIVLAALGLLHDARGSSADTDEIPDAFTAAKADRAAKKKRTTKGSSDRRHDDGDTGWVHVSLGRVEGVRPADLVGAIANEGGLSGAQIGPIKIAQHHSRVGIPASSVAHVVEAMGDTTVRGQRASVRRWVE
ncbi:DEAD/DEAH box helicase [Salsipaludibacter albus]|uniref:DEAD/DEAH box helicase n=1 Tax=Salsipaludibacter albus TaxID=2849650 RepID=UPI001EE3B120|nr:DEAD/DEAH box helicase [Salsipaludibacter albus]MBY5161198.1 DEAD/DEAH box helicase [Salsipaludibacter albus]